MKPASALWPKCVAKATVLRSIVTNIAPRNRYAGTSTARPVAANRELRTRAAGERDPGAGPGPGPGAGTGAGAGARVTTGGSVDRCEANHSDPPRAHRAAHVTPAAGCTWVASRVTAAGPTTKHSSSATDSTENA